MPTTSERQSQQSNQLARWVTRWLPLFTGITTTLLLSATVVLYGLRAYWLWSVAETKKDVEAAVQKSNEEYRKEQSALNAKAKRDFSRLARTCANPKVSRGLLSVATLPASAVASPPTETFANWDHSPLLRTVASCESADWTATPPSISPGCGCTDRRELEKVYRWELRGLPVQMAVKKVSVDRERDEEVRAAAEWESMYREYVRYAF